MKSLINRKFTGCKVIADAKPYQTTQQGKYGRIKRNRARSLVRCNCENKTEFIAFNDCLISGQTIECKICSGKRKGAKLRKHGHSGNDHTTRTHTYRIWLGMKQRCFNPKMPKWKNHGGRGITVCQRWRDSFKAFLEDMGECPIGLTIERIKNDDNYRPDNCRWATYQEQNRNSRRNVVLTVRNKTGCLLELCEHFGLNYNLIYGRLRLGWPIEDAFFIPKQPHGGDRIEQRLTRKL